MSLWDTTKINIVNTSNKLCNYGFSVIINYICRYSSQIEEMSMVFNRNKENKKNKKQSRSKKKWKKQNIKLIFLIKIRRCDYNSHKHI